MNRVSQLLSGCSGNSVCRNRNQLQRPDLRSMTSISATYEPVDDQRSSLLSKTPIGARQTDEVSLNRGGEASASQSLQSKKLIFKSGTTDVKIDRYLFKPHKFIHVLEERKAIPNIKQDVKNKYEIMISETGRVGERIEDTLNEKLYPELCTRLASGHLDGKTFFAAIVAVSNAVVIECSEECDEVEGQNIRRFFISMKRLPVILFTAYLRDSDKNAQKEQKELPGPYSLLVPMSLLHADKIEYFLQNIGRWCGVLGFIVLAYYVVSMPTENGVPRGLAILDKGDFSDTLARYTTLAEKWYGMNLSESVETMIKNMSFVTALGRGKEPAFETEVHEVSKAEETMNGVIASLMVLFKQSGLDGYIGMFLFMCLVNLFRLICAFPSACCAVGNRVTGRGDRRPAYRASPMGSMILRDPGDREEAMMPSRSRSHVSSVSEASLERGAGCSSSEASSGRGVVTEAEVSLPRESLDVEASHHLMSEANA